MLRRRTWSPDAARTALADDRIGYTDALGIAPLRQAIAGHYRKQYDVGVDPGQRFDQINCVRFVAGQLSADCMGVYGDVQEVLAP